MGRTVNLGQQLDEITRDLDATTKAWAEAGHPSSGPEYEAREAVFDRLHEWNENYEKRWSQ